MSVKVNYKGEEILSADTDITKTLKTSGKYCEDDIEIVNTQDGGGAEDGLSHATSISFKNAVIPSDFTVTLPPAVTNFANMFYNAKMEEERGTLTVKSTAQPTDLSNAFCMVRPRPETIVLDFDTSRVSNWKLMFSDGSPYVLKNIAGELDFSSYTTKQQLAGTTLALQNIRFKPNTLSLWFSYGITNNSWTEESTVSLANGLNENAIAQSVNIKAAHLGIMGTVAMDETNTYHIFTADSSGDMTLQDFVTNVKGWTIA